MNFPSRLIDTQLVVTASEDEIRDEPMIFWGSFDWAYKNGGPLTRQAIVHMCKIWPDCDGVIDTRSHMLMPGMYPCIPGWHLDGRPRYPETGQPIFSEDKAGSAMLCVIGPSALTEFVVEDIEISKWSATHTYKSCSEQIAEMRPSTQTVKSGHLYQFDGHTWHRGMPSEHRCWRWFFRASINDGRSPVNELRTQVQVYTTIDGGW
ncbi:MAG: hypothetical protein JKY67_00025 [Pseudomonadales bacterium]|nr:hypothetical protein [Pseudomonadales bacterium]